MLKPAAVAVSLLGIACRLAFPQSAVWTANSGNARTNAVTAETVLRPGVVSPERFGRLYSLPVDGQVYAQPLVIPGVDIPGSGKVDLVIVATTRNSVYAFEAGSARRSPLWRVSLGRPVPAADYSVGGYYYEDLLTSNGILSTPVVDVSSQTLFVVAATVSEDGYAYTLHALDLKTGESRSQSGTRIRAEVPGLGGEDDSGVVRFNPFWQLQRPALLLARGKVYVAFGSHGGVGVYHGWIMAYDAADISKQVAVYNTSPDSRAASIWMSGRGIAADEDGSIYVVTGNGPFDGTRNFGESMLKLDENLTLESWFAPDNYEELNEADNDFGACGAVLIPGTNLVASGGKEGRVFLLDRNRLGGLSEGNQNAVQAFRAAESGVYTMAVWNRDDGARLFVQGGWDSPAAFQWRDGRFDPIPVNRAGTDGGTPYYGMTVSSDAGNPSSGILWVTSSSTYLGTEHPGILRAFDANDLSRELWNSELDPADALPSFSKFVSPTVANGLVYVPTFSNQVVVYGPKGSVPAAPRDIAVRNAFQRTAGPISPGELIEIETQGLGPSDTVSFERDPSGILPDELAGITVLIGGEKARLVEVSRKRALAVVPYSVAGQASVDVEVYYGDKSSPPLSVPVAQSTPGLQSVDGTGAGRGVFLNEDGTSNAPGNPAAPGSVVTVQMTGVGPTTPQNASLFTGDEDVEGFPKPTLPITATIGGEPAEVLSCGVGQYTLGAVLNLRLRVPEAPPTGVRIPVIVRVGGETSAAVTMAIRQD